MQAFSPKGGITGKHGILLPFVLCTTNHSHLDFISFQHEVQIMYVCLCRGITDNQIRKAVQAGKTEFRQLKQSLEVGTNVVNVCAWRWRSSLPKSTRWSQSRHRSITKWRKTADFSFFSPSALQGTTLPITLWSCFWTKLW